MCWGSRWRKGSGTSRKDCVACMKPKWKSTKRSKRRLSKTPKRKRKTAKRPCRALVKGMTEEIGKWKFIKYTKRVFGIYKQINRFNQVQSFRRCTVILIPLAGGRVSAFLYVTFWFGANCSSYFWRMRHRSIFASR